MTETHRYQTPRVESWQMNDEATGSKSVLPNQFTPHSDQVTKRSGKVALQMLTDLLSMGIGCGIAVAVASTWIGQPPTVSWYLSAVLASIGWCLALTVFGRVNSPLGPPTAQLSSVLRISVAAMAVAGAVIYVSRIPIPREFYLCSFMFGFLMVALVHCIWIGILRRRWRIRQNRRSVVVVGSVFEIEQVIHVLRREFSSIRVVAAVTNDRLSVQDVPVIGSLDQLPEIIKNVQAEVYAFAGNALDSGKFVSSDVLSYLFDRRISVVCLPLIGLVNPRRLRISRRGMLPVLEIFPARKFGQTVKRIIDVFGSAMLLVLSSPVFIGAMFAIKLEDGGPIFFKQRRVGLNGEEFDCLKFRTMCVDAEARLAELHAKNKESGYFFKMMDDPRITRVGWPIRRYSIDELPQLWNVLLGDMSLVGPRPALPKEVSQYDFDTRRRLRVPPGLTGLWQVSGRSRLSWEDAVRLDLYYVDNWSLTQDMVILLRTAKAVVGPDGAY